jgi:IS6 family transposase
MSNPSPFKGRHFEASSFCFVLAGISGIRLGYQGLEEMMRECGLQIDHTTIYRSTPALPGPVSHKLLRSVG